MFGCDLSVKVLLLVAIAGVALRFLRIRDSNARHRVWTGVLTGMLLLPALALVLPPIPLTLPTAFARENVMRAAKAAPESKLQPERSEGFGDERQFGAATANRQTELSSAAPVRIAVTAQAAPRSASPEAPLSRSLRGATGATIEIGWRTLTLSLWLAGVLALFGKLVIGLWTAAGIRRRAIALREHRIQCSLDQLSPRPHAALAVRETTELIVPVTTGWWSPTILLPVDWRSWDDPKLLAVLAHEVAHVNRRDFSVVIAAEFNRCLYWFHPASWWLRKWLADLAEEACDDAAIEETGNAAGYARYVLEIASRLTSTGGQRARLAVSMARESNVEVRIATILDRERRRSRQLSWNAALAIAGACLLMVSMAAALRPVRASANEGGDQGTPADQATAKQATAKQATAKQATTPAEPTVRVHGQVMDEAGQPLSRAKVRIYRLRRAGWYAAPPSVTLLKELAVDSGGRFDAPVPKAAVYDLPPSDSCVMVISAPGYAHETFEPTRYFYVVDDRRIDEPGFVEQRIEAKLPLETKIRGRLLSIEGHPISGASVQLAQMARSKRDALSAWIKHAQEHPLAESEDRRMMTFSGAPDRAMMFPALGQLQLAPGICPAVKTDAKGEFEIHGVGENDAAVVQIRGEGIANADVHCLGRDIETIRARHIALTSSSGAYYGRNFDFVAQPSAPVLGVVHDLETNEPLVGIPVAIGSVYGSTMSHTGAVVTYTDDQGRYRIEGLPIPPPKTRKWDRNALSIRPGKLPYLENDSIPIPLGTGLNPVEFNVGLRRATLAKGRVTDRGTGEPVAAELYYAPFRTNAHVEDYQRYADDLTTLLGNSTRYHTDEDGYFEIPVIPGRGVLAAKCRGSAYVTGFGKDAIAEFRDAEPGLGRTLSDYLSPASFHSLRELDVPLDTDAFEVDLEVNPGTSLTVKFVDPEGNPLQGVQGYGIRSRLQHDRFPEAQAQAAGLAVGQIRSLGVEHTQRDLALLHRLTPEPGQKDVTLKLLPRSIVRGRLIDPDGRPLEGVSLEARHRNDPDSMRSLTQVQTDAEGRFEYALTSGTQYRIIGFAEKVFTLVGELDIHAPQRIDFGDVVVDPEAKRWADATAKGPPVVKPLDSP